jgi:hypothetical protein
MRKIFTAALCAASLGLVALSPPAVAQQKTTRQCNDEWAADRAAIQASGKTKRVFVAECRGVPVPAVASRTMMLGKGQYPTEAEAKGSCPSDAIVWVNLRSKVRQPQLREDQARRIHVRAGVGHGRLPRAEERQAWCDLSLVRPSVV